MSGKIDKSKGTIKEVVGKVTKNKDLETEGHVERKVGEAKEKVSRVTGKIEKAAHKVEKRAEDVLDKAKVGSRKK